MRHKRDFFYRLWSPDTDACVCVCLVLGLLVAKHITIYYITILFSIYVAQRERSKQGKKNVKWATTTNRTERNGAEQITSGNETHRDRANGADGKTETERGRNRERNRALTQTITMRWTLYNFRIRIDCFFILSLSTVAQAASVFCCCVSSYTLTRDTQTN